ncbi:MAG TPA: hypothetical protein P5052_00890 [Candidatus Paceibacterota bacterium]|nr:hypothetical protein [Candidatus Paceibacterota bacterium]HRZ29343.1 hypothetical protein [Candidatus Paceibacterota bacterium]
MKNKNLIYLAVLIVIVVLIIILNKLDIIRINFNVPNTINTSTSMPLDNENINSLKGTTSSFSDLSKCKKEVIDNNEFNVFEG